MVVSLVGINEDGPLTEGLLGDLFCCSTKEASAAVLIGNNDDTTVVLLLLVGHTVALFSRRGRVVFPCSMGGDANVAGDGRLFLIFPCRSCGVEVKDKSDSVVVMSS